MNIKIDLSDIIKDARKFALIYIDFESLKYVSSVIDHICNILQLSVQTKMACYDAELSLYDDIWYIPSRESSLVLKEISGILRLCYVRKECRAVNSLSLAVENTKGQSHTSNPEPLNKEGIHSNPSTFKVIFSEKNREEEVSEECDMKSEELGKNEDKQVISKTTNIKNSVNSPTNTSYDETSIKKCAMLDIMKSVGPFNECKSEVKNDMNLIQSAESLEEFFNLPVHQKKRKRKHGKKKKLNGEVVKEFTHERIKHNKINDNMHNEGRREDNIFKRSHIIFSESDEERKVTLKNVDGNNDFGGSSNNDTCNLQLHEIPISHSTLAPLHYSFNKNFEAPTQTEKYNGDFVEESIKPREEPKLDIAFMSKATHLDSDVSHFDTNSVNLEILAKCPPQPCCSIEEPSSEILSKFKKILALEAKLQLEVFTRDENRHNFCQEGSEGWDSLLLSFASQKEMANRKPHLHESFPPRSLNQPITFNDLGCKSSLTCINSDHSQEVVESPLQEVHIGAKVHYRSKRYFTSVGGILNVLKNSANATTNVNSRRDKSTTPPCSSTSTAASSCFTIPRDTERLNEGDDPIESCENRKNNFIKNDVENFVDNNAILHGSDDQEICTDEGTCDEKVHVEFGSTNLVIGKREGTKLCPIERKCQPEVEKIDINDQEMERQSGEEDCDYTVPVYDLESEMVCDDKQNKNGDISYELYPLLSSLPKVGDIIATKLLSLDSNMCPHYSDYRPAKVVSVDGLKIGLQFLDVSSCNETSELHEGSTEGECIVLDWRDLLNPRLVFP